MRVCVLLAAGAVFVVGSPMFAQDAGEISAVSDASVAAPILYRGQLSYLDIPVTTSADLRFRLFDASQGGERVGREVTLEDVTLDGGAFEALLDFGAPAGVGWIEVDVRSPSGDGAYITLRPRQGVGVSEAPGVNRVGADAGSPGVDGSGTSRGLGQVAVGASAEGEEPDFELTGAAAREGDLAGMLGDEPSVPGGPRGAGWVMSGSTVYYNGGNVGIGTASPDVPLHVIGSGSRVLRVLNSPTGGSGWGIFAEANGNASRALFARANRSVGQNFGVFGQSLSNRGTGVFGQANSTSGITYGVTGVSRAGSGTGVRGLATNAGGTNVGVYGETSSPNGQAAMFRGVVNGGGNTEALDVLIHNGIYFSSAKFADGWVRADWDLEFANDLTPITSSAWYRFWTNGNPGVGTEQFRISAGNEADVLADGSFVTNGIDYAEAFSVSDQGIEAGDVVSMVRGDWDNIRVSSRGYDDLLLGVVSTKPGFVAGLSFDQEEAASAELTGERDAARMAGQSGRAKELTVQMRALAERQRRPIALAGRVPVKVDASYGAIRAGDRLTSSATPGHAMVQTRPGPSLGIALEDFEAGQGKITLLVQPGWTGLSDQQYEQLEAKNATLEARNADIEERLKLLEQFILGEAP